MSQLEARLNQFRSLQKEIGRVHSSISSAGTQILENEMVLKELEILEDDAQELVEVKNNVGKRIEYIKNDITRLEGNMKKFEKQQTEVRDEVGCAALTCCSSHVVDVLLSTDPSLCTLCSLILTFQSIWQIGELQKKAAAGKQ
ncbi:MAG: hypothetical protein SGPRY_009491 [Prymnesium sp.]